MTNTAKQTKSLDEKEVKNKASVISTAPVQGKENGKIVSRIVGSPCSMAGIAPDGSSQPIVVRKEGWTGTQGHNIKDADVLNIGEGEYAFTRYDAIGLRLKFGIAGLKFGADGHVETAGDPRIQEGFGARIREFLDLSKESPKFLNVSKEITLQIFSGDWGYRNTQNAKQRIITVQWKGADGKEQECCVTRDYARGGEPQQSIEGASIDDVAKELRDQLLGRSVSSFEVQMDIMFRIKGTNEVYPSQTTITRTRIYQRDPFDDKRVIINFRKIWNCLRRIDKAYDEYGTQYPISIEPLGGDKRSVRNFRSGRNSFYSLLWKLKSSDTVRALIDSDDGEYMIGMFIRGHVITVNKNRDKL